VNKKNQHFISVAAWFSVAAFATDAGYGRPLAAWGPKTRRLPGLVAVLVSSCPSWFRFQSWFAFVSTALKRARHSCTFRKTTAFWVVFLK
jgi:hypothetical protein